MSDSSDARKIADADWVEWLVAFNDLSRGFIEDAAIDPPYGDDPRRQSAMLAIAARAFTLFRSALTLIQQGEQLGFRILVRGIVECAMHMEAACSRPEYRCCHVKFLWLERSAARGYSGDTGRNFPCIESFEPMVANCLRGAATGRN
ncbi:hypothetical protein [Rhizobium ruizarguesonis]|uniref:hypothetical protein n=1 Tax=Rhizobium ruizarguesonis TaxID=2081791 RepID=UPI00371FEAAF